MVANALAVAYTLTNSPISGAESLVLFFSHSSTKGQWNTTEVVIGKVGQTRKV